MARRTRVRGRLAAATVAWTAAGAAGVTGLASAPVAAEAVRLTIEGAPTLTIAGTCTFATAAGDKRLDIDTAPPFERAFEAGGLDCRLTATGTGSATVTIAGPRGNRTVTGLVAGGTAVITIR